MNKAQPCSKSLAIDALSSVPDSLSCGGLTCVIRESRPPRTFPGPPLSSLLLDYENTRREQNKHSLIKSI